MIEALIALPLLITLLSAVVFFAQLRGSEQAALRQARRCAFEHAAGGCTDVPPGCEQVLGGVRRAPDAHGESIVQATRAAQPSDFDVLEDIPVLGDALEGLFGTSTYAESTRLVRVPWLDQEHAVTRGALRLICNERHRDVLEAAKEAVCSSDPLAALEILPLCD